MAVTSKESNENVHENKKENKCLEKSVCGLEERFGCVLKDEEEPLRKRFRALFALRNICTDKAVLEISKAFTTSSILLKHELAYVLGQMQNKKALPILQEILENPQENEIVRHEAGEAIATFGEKEYEDLLRKYSSIEVSGSVAVSETCQIGAELISKGGSKESVYGTLDPAHSLQTRSLSELKEVYLNEEAPLYERYRAMFGLRDMCTTESVNVLAEGFYCQKRSDLFEHEIAFVFGQISHPASIKHLGDILADESRHEMVRHECAEALGTFEEEEAKEILLRFKDSENRIVRESVEIGLDIREIKFTDTEMENALQKMEE
ncbi:deoxyhypusine monooxygenase [Nematocida sp. AWRm80]|nr:deoxyhypusine monooxygenase [Nematocida sp. AWRm80]